MLKLIMTEMPLDEQMELDMTWIFQFPSNWSIVPSEFSFTQN